MTAHNQTGGGTATGPRDMPLLVVDGACGTNLQDLDIPDSVWGDRDGCNEYLNLVLPTAIRELHAAFVEAGADVLETNTFGANRVVLAEYDLANGVSDINHTAVDLARAAAEAVARPVFVAGSVGPTTRLPVLGQIAVEEMAEAYVEQMEALVAAGVDLLIVETCQDLLQLKTALIAALDVVEASGRDVPLMVSVTVERTGTLLVGSDIAAVATTVAPFPVFSLGLNCATGPEKMQSHIRYLAGNWPGRISCIPNQGLPEVVDGRTRYRLQPAEYARAMHRFVTNMGVSIVGGCCGTTPEHIRVLAETLRGASPARREVAAS